MRLRRLDLTRYGKFTDHSLDFGERVAGVPDLHVVYGPNEAGKSTTLAAFLDLVFGMGKTNPYNFLHPYPTMRIGGVIDFADGPRRFVRLKQNQNDLLDGNERPIAQSAIQRDLGGIDREAYRTMFSLDDETLEKGGESILASRGDLGELLFSAGAGLADLSRNLGELRGEADRFYRYRARGGTLADLKANLAALKADKDRFDTLASDYARLIGARDRASAGYDEAIAERTALQGRADAIRRSLAALPRLAALRTLRERLAPLEGLPDAPAGWADELPSLQTQEIELGIRLRTVEDELGRLEEEIEAVGVDEAALRLHDGLDWLDGLRARYATAAIDLPERRVQVRAAELAIAGILERLERPNEADPRRLLLGASTVGRLRELIEARAGLDAAGAAVRAERTEAERRLAGAAGQLAASGTAPAGAAPPAGVAGLAAVLQALRGSDHAARLGLAARERDAAAARLADRLAALAPWQGGAEALTGLRCPEPATLQDWKAALEAARTAALRHRGEVERLADEVGRLRAERDAVAGTTGLVDDGEAADLRARREQAWATHRRALDAASAEAFEAALRRDDLAAAGRFGRMAELAAQQQRSGALAVAEAALGRAEEREADAARALQGLREAIAEAVRGIHPALDPAMSPVELDGWLTRRTAALAAREALAGAEAALRDRLAEERAAIERLRVALDGAGLAVPPDAGFAALLATGGEAVDREAALRALRETIEERERDLAARRRAVAEAEAREAAWAAAWSEICAGCWLGEAGPAPGIAAVREILVTLDGLTPAIERRAGLADRIEKMTGDQQAFRAHVAGLADELRIAPGDDDPVDLARRVADRIREAGTERDRRARALAAAEAAHARKAALDASRAIVAARGAAMTKHFGVATLAAVADRLAEVARRAEWRGQAETAEREILDGLGLAAIGQAEPLLDGVDRPALEAEAAALEARLADQARLCELRFAERSAAHGALEAVGGDNQVAEIEGRRRTTLIEIEEGATRYLQLRAGTAATEHGLRAYRERHRSAMMARASDAFRTISRGAYTGLAAQPGRDGDILIALAAGGGAKEAEHLSKGTRFQLYLALRVAGYDEFLRARAPLPFIADDIMETFDDFRAEEAFRLLAEMAEAGQVVYLTHHRHLCDVARRVSPGVRIHELAGG